MEDLFGEFKQISTNKAVSLMNELFAFKREFMKDDSILDAIVEYSQKNDLNPVQLAQELSEFEGFRQIVENDCIKYKYINNSDTDIGDWK